MLSHNPSFKDSPWQWHQSKTTFRPTQGAPIATPLTSPEKRTCTAFWSRNETATFISVKSFKSTSSSFIGLQLAVQRFALPLPLQKKIWLTTPFIQNGNGAQVDQLGSHDFHAMVLLTTNEPMNPRHPMSPMSPSLLRFPPEGAPSLAARQGPYAVAHQEHQWEWLAACFGAFEGHRAVAHPSPAQPAPRTEMAVTSLQCKAIFRW